FKERMLKPLIHVLQRLPRNFIPQEKKQVYENKLLLAGNPHGMNADTFIVVKMLFVIPAVIIGIITRNVLMLLLLVIIALYIPDLYLKICKKNRQNLIVKSLPDVLDLLTVSVEAGLGFDAALHKVIEKTEGPLTDEFEKAVQEINLGKPRREALRDMSARLEVDDVTTFTGSIIQADQLGVSITNVLRIQSAQCRANRKMRAEEQAQKAPIKMLIPLVLFIFPTIFIVLLGPAVFQLMDTFK
ncbi:MAG TPA: type II secretion system F family protein, partial [Syntrophomonadaceae bacterium]|nr:type II secretion system F family protein [Syntrophomonadaceae bacterium]